MKVIQQTVIRSDSGKELMRLEDGRWVIQGFHWSSAELGELVAACEEAMRILPIKRPLEPQQMEA